MMTMKLTSKQYSMLALINSSMWLPLADLYYGLFRWHFYSACEVYKHGIFYVYQKSTTT